MKDLKYYKDNAEEDYIKTPISVLRYITELEEVKQNKLLILYGVVKRFFARNKKILTEEEKDLKRRRNHYPFG
tara:strand:- start:105 stop:323 length:219 start_codon:yes stop_codon:yes gene_type:complete